LGGSLVVRSSAIGPEFYQSLFYEGLMQNDFNENYQYEQKWGNGFTQDEYKFLDKEYKEWIKDRKSESKVENVLLKEVCYKQLEINKNRLSGHDTTTLVKQLSDLLKQI
jgi:ATP-dependent DNA ligase